MPIALTFVVLLLQCATALPCGVGERAEPALEVSAITFNIRYGTAKDGDNAWPHRRDAVIAFIEESDADFIGLQEALHFQLDEITQATNETHGVISRTREAKDGSGEATPLLYDRARWRIDPEQNGTFWLSETPEEPGSKSWESSLPRIATWGRFIERSSGRAVWVFNTHFDHRSGMARHEGAKLIAGRIGDLVPNGAPVIVLGDLNAGEGSAPLRALGAGGGTHPVALVDSWRVAHPEETETSTFNRWGEGIQGSKIDYVLVPAGTRVRSATIFRERIEGRPISDHWPVGARLEFKYVTQ